jgi:hypothetical protein
MSFAHHLHDTGWRMVEWTVVFVALLCLRSYAVRHLT